MNIDEKRKALLSRFPVREKQYDLKLITQSRYDKATDKRYYFYSTDHCQPLGEEWVACSTYLPMNVAPRPCLPDGLVDTKEKYERIFREGDIQIPNPDPKFQPK